MLPGRRAQQDWLFPYVNPLPERFGPEFFRSIPRTSGVYLMYSADGSILYVGKAKDLRARLLSYRRAKPEQVSRKVLRMIARIAEIRWEECASEKDALLRENQLLRQHRPPFNVVNTTPETYYLIGLVVQNRGVEVGAGATELQFHLTHNPTLEMDRGVLPQDEVILFGAYKGRGSVRRGYSALLRLLWAAHVEAPERFAYPGALVRYRPAYRYRIRLAKELSERERRQWVSSIKQFLHGTSRGLLKRLTDRLLAQEKIPPFMYHFVQEDLETLEEMFLYGPKRNRMIRRKLGLNGRFIAQEELDDLLVLALR